MTRVSPAVVTDLVVGKKRALDPTNALGARNSPLDATFDVLHVVFITIVVLWTRSNEAQAQHASKVYRCSVVLPL